MAVDKQLFFELRDLAGRLQVRLRQGLEMRLSGPLETGCAECRLVLLEIGEDLRDPLLAVRIPVSAAAATVDGNGTRRRDFQIALAEAFAEFSMSSGLGLSVADWSTVAGASTGGG